MLDEMPVSTLMHPRGVLWGWGQDNHLLSHLPLSSISLWTWLCPCSQPCWNKISKRTSWYNPRWHNLCVGSGETILGPCFWPAPRCHDLYGRSSVVHLSIIWCFNLLSQDKSPKDLLWGRPTTGWSDLCVCHIASLFLSVTTFLSGCGEVSDGLPLFLPCNVQQLNSGVCNKASTTHFHSRTINSHPLPGRNTEAFSTEMLHQLCLPMEL